MSEDTTLDEFAKDEGENTNQQDNEQHLPEIDENPSDWRLVTVEDISADLIGGGTPSKSNKEYWGGEIPWASVKDLNGIELSETEDHITKSGVENSATNIIPENSIIISTRMTVGEPFINRTEMAINQDMKAIIPDTEQVNPLFFVYSLWDKDPYLKSLGRGTTFDGITTKDLALTHIGLPSLPEQRKIATVLHMVDQMIEKTEEIISQIKRVKQGTVQDLFRRGLYNHETESRRLLGEIPKDWDIVTVGDLCKKVTDGTHKAVPAQETGKPCLTAKNIRDWGFNLDDIKYISEDEHNEILSRCHPENGDLLYVKDGVNTGMVQVNTLDFEFSLLNSVILMKIDEQKIDPQFFEQMLSWEKMKRLIVSRRTGTGIRRVTITNMKKSEVLLPSIEEQREIANILTGFDEQISKEIKLKENLINIKQGLQQDLLSGTVRTIDTNIEVPDEIAQHG